LCMSCVCLVYVLCMSCVCVVFVLCMSCELHSPQGRFLPEDE
jgi:hypothetical protein